MNCRRIRRVNAPLLALEQNHPARLFLEQFIFCGENCIGRELDGFDQQFWSDSEKRPFSFSGFAYSYLAVTIILTDWLNDTPYPSESDTIGLKELTRYSCLLNECKVAATQAQNAPILEMIAEVEKLIMLWRECIEARGRLESEKI